MILKTLRVTLDMMWFNLTNFNSQKIHLTCSFFKKVQSLQIGNIIDHQNVVKSMTQIIVNFKKNGKKVHSFQKRKTVTFFKKTPHILWFYLISD